MYCVYILHSNSLDSYYIGETVDIEKRIKEHNTNFYNKSFTTKAKDWKLFLLIDCKDRVQARKVETHIKKMKSKKYIQNLVKYPEIIEKLKK